MPTLASFLMVSLDGYFEGRNPWELEWHNVDDEFNDFAVDQLDASGCLIFGRRTYQGMAQYWPTAAAMRDDPEVAARMNNMPKIVISETLDRPNPEWENTRLLRTNVADELSTLKQRPGKDLLVLGSSQLTARLIEAGLLDELRIIVAPVVLTSGHSVLSTGKKPVALKLIDTRTFRSGNVLLTYRPERG